MSEHQNLPASYSTPLPSQAYYGGGRGMKGMDAEEGSSGGGVKRYVAALLRYKWLIMAVTVVGTTASFFVGRNLPKTYQAEARFWFDKSKNPSSMFTDDLFKDDAWIALMKSYSVQDFVVGTRRLYIDHNEADRVFESFQTDTMFWPGEYKLVVKDNKMIELSMANGTTLETVPIGSPIGKSRGFIWQPKKQQMRPGREIAFEVMTIRDAAKRLEKNLSVNMPNTTFMAITLKGKDPDEVALTVNVMADRFLFVATELKKRQLVQVRDVLYRQLEDAKNNLSGSEHELFNFQVATITQPTGMASPIAPGMAAEEAPIMQQFTELRTKRGVIEQERNAIKRLLAGAASDSLSVDAMTAVASVARAPELSKELTNLAMLRSQKRAMLTSYTEQQAEVQQIQKAIDLAQNSAIPSLGRAVLTDLDAQAAVLDELILKTAGELQQIPARTIQQGRLARNVGLSADMFNSLQANYEQARLAAETAVPDVQILDYAQGRGQALGNPLIKMLLMGIIGSLGLGMVVAILIDQLDPRFRYADQVTSDLGLSIIGVVPNLISRRRALAQADDSAKVVEALRGIRLNLMHAYGSAGPLTVTISSPGSGDGKTFITSNLALAFADLGMRTLVIDGDTRRGELHRLYDAVRKPGLTDYLGGAVPMEAVVRRTRFPLVDVIPAGSRRSDAPELLSSRRMGDLLAHIRSEYQVILIDSPPLGAGVDPLVLATLCGHMVIVMRTGRTDRTLAGAKLEMLDRLPIRVLGAIVNGLDTSDAYRYYSYLPGYETGNEESEEAEPTTDVPKELEPV
jgi:polysaccharide biosynthesis transport protein